MKPPFPTFSRAIVRKPAFSAVNGLRAVDRGAPDMARLAEEHMLYVEALERAGLQVQRLEAREAYPDAHFVEDPALVFPQGAILLCPGAPSREGEAAEIESVLRMRFPELLKLPRGYVDGGDCLYTPKGLFIGLSSRTDDTGAEALVHQLEQLGIEGRIVETPNDVLHLKSDCSLLDETTILATHRLANSDLFDSFDIIETAEGEEEAANALRVNDRLLVGQAYVKTIEKLRDAGYEVTALPVTETAKLDGGLSCLSLRW